MDIWTGVLLAGQALLLVALAALARIVMAERQARVDASSALEALEALEARIAGVEASAERHALFERRQEAIAPIDALRHRWAQGGTPDRAALATALAAIEKLRFLFPAEISDEVEEASALLTTCLAHLQWEAGALGGGRRDKPADLAERYAGLLDRLRDTIEALHARMSEASRMRGA
ncbi:hypothetical protein [Sphingosinicella terrae]|uniref:hypothetical protein n=1 Tax=Sphingosinicella terrae TaxID=2172047 RepID=UPI000E0D2887|nr:hypothetical protein [Sphingosinicella terrae]